MIQAKHCDLCEYPKRDLKSGLVCGLTDKKPNFKGTCPDILLDEKFQSKVENTNLELHNFHKAKTRVHVTFYVLIVIGFLVIMGNKMYADLTHSSTYSLYYRMSAIAFGIVILMNAYHKLNRYRKKLETAAYEKNKIDSVLKEYGISYEIDFEYKEKVHGNQDIEIITEYENWTKKQTTTTIIFRHS